MMIHWRRNAGVAILAAAHLGSIAACSDSPGADGPNGSAGGSGGQPVTGTGASNAGGFGGGPPSQDDDTGTGGISGLECEEAGAEDECPYTCRESIENLCGRIGCRPLPVAAICGSVTFTGATFFRGCGYILRVDDDKETSQRIWLESTRQLVFSTGIYEAPTCQLMIAGERPACDEWELAWDLICDSDGLGGAGGEGGSAAQR